MRHDALIIGQGVAGSFLARALMRRGQRVVIVDDNHQPGASQISPGIISPLTGKRLALTPQFDLYYQHAMSVYRDLFQDFNQVFFIPKPIFRILRDPQELEHAKSLYQRADRKAYLTAFSSPGCLGPLVNDAYGVLGIAQGGVCNGEQLILAMRDWFVKQGVLAQQVFSYDDLTFTESGVKWRGDDFKVVIFCEGFKAVGNPWFNVLPFTNVKGELLHVRMKAALPDGIFIQYKWLLPLGRDEWLVGATYDRDHLDQRSTSLAKEEIINDLKLFLNQPLEVLGHYAGVRPVMQDQLPVLGRHPQYPQLAIFNGFGSKGFLMAPYLADHLADHLINNQSLQIGDVSRF